MGPNPPATQSRVEPDCAGKAYLIADPAEPWEAPVTWSFSGLRYCLTLPVHLFDGRCDIVYVNLTFPRAFTSWKENSHHFWSLKSLAAFHLTRRHLHLDHSP